MANIDICSKTFWI